MLRRFSAREGFAEARDLYAAGANVTQTLKSRYPDPSGFTDIVRVAYDLQSGTYVAALQQPGMAARKQAMARRILSFIDGLPVHSALEAGCGEATTLSFLVAERPELRWSGFDLSLSRIAWAQSLLRTRDQQAELFVGDLLQIPLAGPAADLVITVHALEPNGDRAPALIAELLRVTGRYLLLVEPDYESASPEQRARMDQHGYIRGIEAALRASPGRILARAPLGDDVNPLNAATVTLFEREAPQPVNPQAAHLPYAPPGGGAPLSPVAGAWLGEENGHAWPAMGGIPYLLPDGAVVASHLGRLA
jgi:SAM-dependent methyltransferase